MTIYLPLHVWDREIDSRLFIAYLEACKGNTVILGHEYNIAPLYTVDAQAILFRAGGPLDHNVRGKWHQDVTSKGGIVITQDEEGVNNMPLQIKSNSGKRFAALNMKAIKEQPDKASITAIKNVETQLTWGTMHRAYLSHKIDNIEARSIAVNRMESASSVRFELLGEFGRILNHRFINATNCLFQRYVLILDNFSVTNMDPSKDLEQAGFDNDSIKKFLTNANKDRDKEIEARKNFSTLIEMIAKKNPDINFIFRPHPVLDKTFWLEHFKDYKNIIVLNHGPIHGWIYGAIATIHSGCTTGLEAFGADTTTFDITNLISERSIFVQNSLIGQSSRTRITTFKELVNQLRSLYNRGGEARYNRKDGPSRENYKDSILSNNISSKKVVDEAYDLIEKNTKEVSEKICARLDLTNASDLIGSNSALAIINRKSNKYLPSTTLNLRAYEKIVGKMAPNQGKSRFYSVQEAENRINDIQQTFRYFGLNLPSVKISKFGINSFHICKIDGIK